MSTPLDSYLEVPLVTASGGGDPGEPYAGGDGWTTVLDMRPGGAQDLNTVFTLEDAVELLALPGNPPHSLISPDIEFAVDFDGNGNNAFRVKWVGMGADPEDRGDQNQSISFYHDESIARPRHVYSSWMSRLGRHAADSGSSWGNVDEYFIANPYEVALGAKRHLDVQEVDGANPNSRIDLVDHGVESPTPPTPVVIVPDVEGFYLVPGASNLTMNIASVNPQAFTGQEVRRSREWKSPATYGEASGQRRDWFEGVLRSNHNAVVAASIGIDRSQYLTVKRTPYVDDVEYIRGLLIRVKDWAA